MVESYFISNAVTLTAKRCQNISVAISYPNKILKLPRVDGMKAAKNLRPNLNFNARYDSF